MILNGVTVTVVAMGLCTLEDRKVLSGRTNPQIINDSMALIIQCVVSVSNMGRHLHVRNHEVKACVLKLPFCKDCLRRTKRRQGNLRKRTKG